MWIIFGLVIGVGLGAAIPYQLPFYFSRYVSVSFLAGLDSILGGSRAGLENRFDYLVFTSGFFFNLILAGVLTYVGDLLGVELYLAGVITFGVRIFENLAIIRRDLIGRPPTRPQTLSSSPVTPTPMTPTPKAAPSPTNGSEAPTVAAQVV